MYFLKLKIHIWGNCTYTVHTLDEAQKYEDGDPKAPAELLLFTAHPPHKVLSCAPWCDATLCTGTVALSLPVNHRQDSSQQPQEALCYGPVDLGSRKEECWKSFTHPKNATVPTVRGISLEHAPEHDATGSNTVTQLYDIRLKCYARNCVCLSQNLFIFWFSSIYIWWSFPLQVVNLRQLLDLLHFPLVLSDLFPFETGCPWRTHRTSLRQPYSASPCNIKRQLLPLSKN